MLVLKRPNIFRMSYMANAPSILMLVSGYYKDPKHLANM